MGRTIIVVVLNPDPLIARILIIVKLPILDPAVVIVSTVVASLQCESTRTGHGHTELGAPKPELIIVIVVIELVWLIIVIVEVDVVDLSTGIDIARVESVCSIRSQLRSKEWASGGKR